MRVEGGKLRDEDRRREGGESGPVGRWAGGKRGKGETGGRDVCERVEVRPPVALTLDPSDSVAPAPSALSGPSPAANSFRRFPSDSSPLGEGGRGIGNKSVDNFLATVLGSGRECPTLSDRVGGVMNLLLLTQEESALAGRPVNQPRMTRRTRMGEIGASSPRLLRGIHASTPHPPHPQPRSSV